MTLTDALSKATIEETLTALRKHVKEKKGANYESEAKLANISVKVMREILNDVYDYVPGGELIEKIQAYLIEEDNILTQQTQKQLKLFFEKNGSVSQNLFSKKCGFSPAVLNQFMQGKYQGDIKATRDKINETLRREAEKKKYGANAIDYIETENTQLIISAIQDAQHLKGISIIVGDSGCGKTTAIEEFKMRESRAIVIHADMEDSPYELLIKIARACGLIYSDVKKWRIRDGIIKKLRDTDSIIIVDEAQFLNYRKIEIFRRIADRENANIGLAFLGHERLEAQMFGKDRSNYAQIRGRVVWDLPLHDGIKAGDAEKIISAYLDIDKMPDGLRNDLVKIANRQGQLHRLVNLLKRAKTRALRSGRQEITEEDLLPLTRMEKGKKY